MKMRPVIFKWEDGKMVPIERYRQLADRQFVAGFDYVLEHVPPRNMKSHSHYFATIHEIWNNLPETETRFPSADHLRHWALVQAGFCIEKNFICDSPKLAKNLAVFIRSIDQFGIITISGNVVRVFEAKSQSTAAMNAEEFQESKKRVLDICSALIPGLSKPELSKQAARRAPLERIIP